jgi:hypothetical protein
MEDVMNIYRYQAASPADAFEAASKDASHWNFNEMLALAEMADKLRNGYPLNAQRSTIKSCVCKAGFFKLFEDDLPRGYGIGCICLFGHESGVADDAAQEILDFHREQPEQATYAAPLLVWSEYISKIAELDRGYELLLRSGFVTQSKEEVVVSDEVGRKVKRPKYKLRAPGIPWFPNAQSA